MTKYAKDEFDQVPQNTSRQGVHRDAQETARPTLWPVLTVGAVALVLGLVAFLILPNLGLVAPGAASNITTPAPQQTSTAPSAAPTESGSAPTPSGEPTASGEPGGEATAEPTPSASPSATASSAPVDKTTPVAVYNGAGTAGLAGRVAGLVQGDGWALSTVGNWGGLPQQTSVIFYNAPEQKANAEALGTLLGIETIVETPEVQQPLVVVAGPGFQ
ncbi:LytR C-terminal domain-containing protein [Paenarthrobacter aurescens]|uniref:LytR/CpsA/Psr regulator C-terminal domain-containing protein n=1 Tax=Paenarthrobacter aurescens TaxID=43663 RepID=A0A4Y3NPC3_PAEAU|nr:LytR C-terminal domain-containing protein [Paenarthrobacter aurescens]UKA50849.1 LytR C-terminal domain-containing protein [Arthrobacter sp. FW305-123]MDO6142581.1 LytR C-terminal domain-containing protein [Paenarthrobacter aurescens]MDO6146428.1 LytR C-terminal domain-containing protein [Paenarthrobacter aurescens]MDO6157673.1 LytR C-terminal domain-containing protein [Paenarthrobacter aurescens]MDO6161658.1 LytR C-terminal domain-containing protein [Paenarthrobacter aurescens]